MCICSIHGIHPWSALHHPQHTVCTTNIQLHHPWCVLPNHGMVTMACTFHIWRCLIPMSLCLFLTPFCFAPRSVAFLLQVGRRNTSPFTLCPPCSFSGAVPMQTSGRTLICSTREELLTISTPITPFTCMKASSVISSWLFHVLNHWVTEPLGFWPAESIHDYGSVMLENENPEVCYMGEYCETNCESVLRSLDKVRSIKIRW